MDFMNIISAVLALGIMGLVLAAILAVASKVFEVKTDERVGKICDVLPGANCGGCGYAGCSNLAAEIVAGNAPIYACTVGGHDVSSKIAEIMGVSDDAPLVRTVAHVACRGGDNAKKKFQYVGLTDCLAAKKVAGGPTQCKYGCIGLGTCVKACPFGAIDIYHGVAVVKADQCKACGKCISACPQGLISLVSYAQDVFVSCSNHDKGAQLRQFCNIGCIGCRLCVKACPTGAIAVDDNLAHIDYALCTNCGACAKACPRKLIVNASEVTSENAAELAKNN